MIKITTIGSLFVNLNADTSNFDKGMSKAQSRANGFGNVMKGIGKQVASFMVYDVGKKLVTGFVDAAKAGINYNSTLETSAIKWETLLGTQEKANKMLKEIEKFAATTPFEKMGVDKMAGYLHNAGFEGDKLFNQLRKFGDVSGAFDIQADSLQEMVRQYAQVQNAGVAYTEDLNILEDRSVPIMKNIAEVMGIGADEVKKFASEGKITADIYNEALDRIAKSSEGGMQKLSESYNGIKSTIKDTMGQIAGTLAQPIFDKLKDGAVALRDSLSQVAEKLAGGDSLMSVIQEFAPGIAPFIESAVGIFTTMGETVGVIVQSMTDFWNEHSSWIMPIVSFAWGFIGGFISNTITAIGQVVQSGLAVVDGIINFFQNLFQGNFSECWESIKQIFSNAITLVWNWMQVQFAVNLPNMIKNFGSSFKGWIDDAWIAVKKFFKNGADDVVKAAKDGFRKTLESVIEKMKEVPKEVKNFMDEAVNKIKDIDLRQIGKDLIQGLINGVKSMGSDVIGALGNVVQSGIDAAKKKLGIKSPSRVFAQIGKDTGAGLINGLEKEGQSVANASRMLATRVVGGYDTNLKGLKTNISTKITASKTASSSPININFYDTVVKTDRDIEQIADELAFYLKRRSCW